MLDYLMNLNSGMKAIMFLDKEIVEECVKKFDNCEISNVNSPNQVIISGLNNELELCASLCVEMGARKVIDLNVDGAFHSKFLKKASTEFLEYIKKFKYDNQLNFNKNVRKVLSVEDFVENNLTQEKIEDIIDKIVSENEVPENNDGTGTGDGSAVSVNR